MLRTSPNQMVNRFTTLGSTRSPRPSFQSALISPMSPYDPFELVKPQKPFIRYPKTSPYFAKEPPHNLFIVESDFSHLKSPEAIAKAYFPPRWHFSAIHPDKSIEFYRDILLQTKSIQINPIPCHRTPGRIAFHSLFIMKFVSQKDWGMPPYALRSLSNRKVQFSYHDYVDAWYKVLCTKMRNLPTLGLSILIETLKDQFLHGFTGGGKFMDLFTKSSLRKSKKPYGISLP
jgi:hypothetical protein